MTVLTTRSDPRIGDGTIIAVATPPEHAALGIVRISGPDTMSVLERHCAGRSSLSFENNPRKAVFCRILDNDGRLIDEGLATFFPGPASYTGEDLAEISLHGNPLLLRRFVLSVLTNPAVRPAAGGEFTRRAFLNGKMDLTQAEAVRRIVEARSEYELQACRRNLRGEVTRLISKFRSALLNLKAETEAEVDFSTEDLTFESRALRFGRVKGLIADIQEILDRSDIASGLASGIPIALVGVPNAGKSSLFNALLGHDRAIVSTVPGTTRDYLSEEIRIDGVRLRISDTAGLRESADVVEIEGLRRSHEEAGKSRIVLHVVDGSLPVYELPEVSSDAEIIYVINKSDIAHPKHWTPWEGQSVVRLSCKTGAGMDDLRETLRERIFSEPAGRDPLLLEDRQRHHFTRIQGALEKTLQLWETNAPEEVTALEIDTALEHAGEITGTITNEEVLGRIFSMFCVGK